MKKLALLLSVLLLFLPGCQAITFPKGEELLAAPMLNSEQRAIYQALEATLNTQNIIYRYPRKGDIKTPFVFHDMDGDGIEEAIVFYSEKAGSAEASMNQEIRAKVLRQDKERQWYSFRDLPGYGNQVAFVEFASLLENSNSSMIIGWETTNNYRDNAIGVYSLVDGRMSRELFVENYSNHTLYDFDDDGLQELLLAKKSTQNELELALYRKQTNGLVQTDTQLLNANTFSILQMLPGTLWGGRQGIYIDQRVQEDSTGTLSSFFYATEVVEVVGNSLVLLAGESAQKTSVVYTNYLSTHRLDLALSADLNRDGHVYVPQVETLPGTPDSDEKKKVKLTDYRQLTPTGFVSRYNTLVNDEDGYLIFLPDKWLGNIIVIRTPEKREWKICKLNQDTGEESTELLRIRVYSAGRSEGSQELFLGNRGSLAYYGYVPDIPGEPLSITPLEAADMFTLLAMD